MPYTETDHSQQFSEELRMSSRNEAPFQWLGGLFYSSFQYRFQQYSANSYFGDFSAGGAAANPAGELYVADIRARRSPRQSKDGAKGNFGGSVFALPTILGARK